jgi:hypothetical protein
LQSDVASWCSMVDTARHLRYTSRAKREADVSLSHRCTMAHHDATGVSPRDKRCES